MSTSFSRSADRVAPRPRPPAARANSGRLGFLIGPAFLLLAVWFLWGPALTHIPLAGPAVVPPGSLSTGPRRQILGDPPTIEINSFRRTCTDCHSLFPLGSRPIADRQQHTHIVLDHGINDQCRNCHDITDMNRLVLHSGQSISYTEVPHLCQKCHGPTYRDWERGIHGRVNDYWNPDFGPPRKLKCIQCHDPHRPRVPAMEPLVPLPRPNTLRMGTPVRAEHAAEELASGDPLRRALLRPEGAHGPDEAQPDRERFPK